MISDLAYLASLEDEHCQFEEQMHPPYRGVVRCLNCRDAFETGEEYLDHMDGCRE